MKKKSLLRPDQIKDYLDQYIIGQDEAKIVLSVAVYNHYKRILHKDDPYKIADLEKSNIILLGNTGCGKTLLVKTIAKLLDVPCYIQDCTKLTASGYVGSDVEDCICGLLRSCNYNIEAAKKGIIVLDEGDKIAKKEVGLSNIRDVSGECVQQSLLKIIEGDLVGVPPMGGRKHPEQPLLYIDTTDILFILSGAFVGLDELIEKRIVQCGKKTDNFATPNGEKKECLYSEICQQDLRSYGMIPEFVGRFPIITYVRPLDKKALQRILVEPQNSIIKQYQEIIREDGMELQFSEAAIEEIAQKAFELNSGARGLRRILEIVMLDIMYQVPINKKASKRILITEDIVKSRLAHINEI